MNINKTTIDELNSLLKTGKIQIVSINAEVEMLPQADNKTQPSSPAPFLAPPPATAFTAPADIVGYALSTNASVDQLAAIFGGKPKALNALMLSQGYKKVFGRWRRLGGNPDKVDLSSKEDLIRNNCLDGFRLRSIAKEYGVEDITMEKFINNTLHLHWDDAKKMWLKN